MKKYKRRAADGMINTEAGGGGQPQGGQPQGQPPQGGGQQGGQQGGGPSIEVSMVLNMQGQQQPLDQMTIASPDDLKQLVQYIMQVFQKMGGGQGGGQQGGQPEGQPGGGQPQGPAPAGGGQ